jgi:hypothetical protein
MVHVALSCWSIWCDLVGPCGVILLVHVSLSGWPHAWSGWSTCRYLVGPPISFLLVHMSPSHWSMWVSGNTTRYRLCWLLVGASGGATCPFLLGHISTWDCTMWLLLDAQHMFTGTLPPFWTHSDTVTFSTFPHLNAQHMFRSIPS